MSLDVECPYCEKWNEINHEDGYGYHEDEVYQQGCSHCDKTFTYRTSVIFHYSAEKAPCLNGEDHKWKPTITHPKYFTTMICEYCGEEREPTIKEKQQYEIPLTYDS